MTEAEDKETMGDSKGEEADTCPSGVARDDHGRWAKGQSGNPAGRTMGGADRVQAIMDACERLGREMLEKDGVVGASPKDCVAAWIATLDPRTMAMLYSKSVPREQQVEFTGATYEDMLQGLREKTAERRAAADGDKGDTDG